MLAQAVLQGGLLLLLGVIVVVHSADYPDGMSGQLFFYYK